MQKDRTLNARARRRKWMIENYKTKKKRKSRKIKQEIQRTRKTTKEEKKV
jgi:hypothetical protein